MPASYFDLKYREIPFFLNRIILALIVFLLLLSALLDISAFLSSIFSLFFFLAVYFLNLAGGADAKLLMLGSIIFSLLSLSLPLSLLFPVIFFLISSFTMLSMPLSKSELRVYAGILRQPSFLISTLVTFYFLGKVGLLLVMVFLMVCRMKASEIVEGDVDYVALEDLKEGMMVAAGIKNGKVVRLGDFDLFMKRMGKKFEYIPPLCLTEENIDEVRKVFERAGARTIPVKRSRPGIPGIVVAWVLIIFSFFYLSPI